MFFHVRFVFLFLLGQCYCRVIIQNGNFENSATSYSPWYHVSNTWGILTLTSNASQVHSGLLAIANQNRVYPYEGPCQDVQDSLNPGETMQVSVYAMISGSGGPYTILCTVQRTDVGQPNNPSYYTVLQIKNAQFNTYLKGTGSFTYTITNATATKLKFYCETETGTPDLFLDDVVATVPDPPTSASPTSASSTSASPTSTPLVTPTFAASTSSGNLGFTPILAKSAINSPKNTNTIIVAVVVGVVVILLVIGGVLAFIIVKKRKPKEKPFELTFPVDDGQPMGLMTTGLGHITTGSQITLESQTSKSQSSLDFTSSSDSLPKPTTSSRPVFSPDLSSASKRTNAGLSVVQWPPRQDRVYATDTMIDRINTTRS